MASTCDIVILGGGVLGASAAFHLAQRRPGRIVLLERSFLGAGGSGQRSAHLFRSSPPFSLAGMVQRSQQAYESFSETVGGPAVFTRTGLVLVVSAGESEAVLADNETLRKQFLLNIQPVSELELLELDSNAHLSEGERAFLDREAGTLDAVQVIASYAEAARRAGVELCQGVEVQRIVVNKSKVAAVETNEGTYECGALVLTAGAWAPSLVRELGLSLPLRACRSPLAVFRRPPDSGRRSTIHVDRVQGMTFQPVPGDLLLAASHTSEELEKDATPESSSEAVTAEWLGQARQRLSRRYPSLHRAYGRGGYRALAVITTDSMPILDRLPGIEGGYCAVGFGTRDVELAPAAGEVVADLVLDGQSITLDVSSLGLARFDKTP
jgi:sarcosine oxidase, subunit beta